MMKDICGINNFAPLVLRGGYSQYCIALSGYVNAWRTFGACYYRTLTFAISSKETKANKIDLQMPTLSGYVNAWRTFGAFLPALTSAEKSAKGAKSLTLGNAQGKKNKYL